MFIIKNQKGMSLPIVLSIAALVTANIYFFLSMDKRSKTETMQSSARINEQAERRRISSLLADYLVCNRNLAGKTLPTLALPILSFSGPTDDLTTTDGVSFLSPGKFYIGASHRVRKFYLEYTSNNVTPTPFSYSLTVEYDIPTVNAQKVLEKKGSIIKIPLYVERTSAAPTIISRCFARPEQITTSTGNDIETAIQQACLGATANFKDKDITDPDNYKICEHYFKQIPPVAPGFVFDGIVINPDSDHLGSYGFSSATLITACPTPSAHQYFFGITDSVADCREPPSCPAGSMMLKSGTSYSCFQNCPAQFLHQNINRPSGCIERQKPCPAGTYTREVRPDGTVDCQPIILKNKFCPPGDYFATDINPENGGNPIVCSNYSKTKSCASPSKWTFISSLNAHPNPPCYRFTY